MRYVKCIVHPVQTNYTIRDKALMFNVNGITYQIKFGEEVELPEAVYHAFKDAVIEEHPDQEHMEIINRIPRFIIEVIPAPYEKIVRDETPAPKGKPGRPARLPKEKRAEVIEKPKDKIVDIEELTDLPEPEYNPPKEEDFVEIKPDDGTGNL